MANGPNLKPKTRGKPPLKPRKLIGLLLCLVVLFFVLRWFEHQQVYFPSSLLQGSAAELGRPFEQVYFQTADQVELHAWFFPAEPESPRSHLAVLIAHGNAGNISHRLELCAIWLELGVNVLAFDYRGYGRSQGRPSEEGTYLDAQAASQWLRDKGITQILAHGESLGGAVAAELALREPLDGIVLQSTFTSVPDIGAELFPWLPVRLLASIHYDTINKLPRVKAPVLVMHSRTDEIIGFHHGEKNYAAARHPKLFREIQGGHNEQPWAGRDQFKAALDDFLVEIEE
jgi:uncharacterized protein